jgi:ribosomal protein L40E
MSAPQIGYFCGSCRRYNVYSLPLAKDAGVCVECGAGNASQPSASLRASGPIDRCPQCENVFFYVRKDFPQQLGCAAVSATILLSTIAYALWDVPAAIAVLALASLADFALYHRLKDVTVCYRCHAELRGFAPNPEHGPFDMHRAEEYDVP